MPGKAAERITPARWQRIKSILADALEREDRAERALFVEQCCQGDAALRREVESFLDRETNVLEKIADGAGAVLRSQPETAKPGRRLGAYELVREVGRGGMGTVYLARRADGRFEQQVAVKLLKRGTDTEEVLRRFHAERRILARLEHPNIARLLDGGETEDGLPFFVMEYVPGVPLTAFARQHGLSVAARLELFGKVCEAVQFAHQNLVVHRDLKPGNILVTATGEPKLLDFGLARLLGPVEGDRSALEVTLEESRRLTPAYASPEQVRGTALTTVSDVYSLGSILYELLANRPSHIFNSPHPPAAELLRVITEQEPTRLSLAADAKIRSLLRGDLDNIVALALRKDAARRYQTVSAFADDLRRHLESRPVRARPDTWRYRTAKFVFLALTAAVVISIREARQAERRFDDVRALAHSFLFDFHDSIRDLPGSTPARHLLVTQALAYLERLEREASGDVALRRELAQAYIQVGDVQGRPNYSNLGNLSGALSSYRRAVAIAESLPGDGISEVVRADAWNALGELLAGSDPTRGDALRLIRRALQVREAWLARMPQEPAARRAVATSLLSLGDAVFSRDVEVRYRHDDALAAERLYRRALSLCESLHAEFPSSLADARGLAKVHYRLGGVYYVLGQIEHNDHAIFERGLEHHHHSIQLREASLAAHPANGQLKRDLADGLTAKAALQTRFGDPAGALADCRRAINLFLELAAADPDNHWARLDLAFAFYSITYPQRAIGDLSGAILSANRVVEIYDSMAAADPASLPVVGYLGSILRLRTELCREHGDFSEAQASARRWEQCAERLCVASPKDEVLRADLERARAFLQP